MSDKRDNKRRWGVDQRLEFIEFRLFWDGALNRSDIVDRFGVSSVQASNDLARYKALAPHNLDYDGSQKRFIASESFELRVMVPNADRYLVQLKAIADGVISLDETNIGIVPSADAMPIPHRRVDPATLRRLLITIRARCGIRICYHSMNAKRPHPLWRDITPHAFAFDGLRWHIRAWCHLEARFKDFVLSRVLELGDDVEPGRLADEDSEWNEFFEVVLVPNPRLAPMQRDTIARDYGMTHSQIRVPVRRALLYYFNKRLRLDLSQSDSPKEAPVVVENYEAFLDALNDGHS